MPRWPAALPRGNWTRPAMHDDRRFEIEGGRHPVVEAALSREGAPFVANDCALNPDADGAAITLLTGPNMAGKIHLPAPERV